MRSVTGAPPRHGSRLEDTAHGAGGIRDDGPGPCDDDPVISERDSTQAAATGPSGGSPTNPLRIHADRAAGTLAIEWADGHATGIFSWEVLHDLGTNQAKNWQSYQDALAKAGMSRDPASLYGHQVPMRGPKPK